MFIEIRLCNPVTCLFKGLAKIVKTYMVKFNASILNMLKMLFFFVNKKHIHKHNIILTLFFPMFPFDLPENRKLKVF